MLVVSRLLTTFWLVRLIQLKPWSGMDELWHQTNVRSYKYAWTSSGTRQIYAKYFGQPPFQFCVSAAAGLHKI